MANQRKAEETAVSRHKIIAHTGRNGGKSRCDQDCVAQERGI